MHTWNLIVMAYLCRKTGLQATTLSAWKMTLLSWYGKESLLLTNNIITPLFVCAFCFCQQLAKTQYSFSPRGAFHQTEFWLLFYFVGKMHTLKGRRSCGEFLIPCTLLPHLGSGRFGHYIHLVFRGKGKVVKWPGACTESLGDELPRGLNTRTTRTK